MLQVLNDALLVQHQRELLEKEHTGLRALLKAHADADIARMYALYSAIPSSLPFIAGILQAHIQDLGASLLSSSSTGASTAAAAPSGGDGGEAAPAPAAAAPGVKSNYIEELMKMHDTYFELVRTAFHGHGTFQRALKEAFSTIVNRPASAASSTAAGSPDAATPAELLASYADDVLRKGGGVQLEGAALERTLDSIVRLFSYLTDKDLFAEFFRKQLATRLLSQRSSSSDAEKSLIGKLKLSMGAQFTSKFEGMFNDMRNAAELVQDFARVVQERNMDLAGIEFQVHTLTTGFWPSYPVDDLKLPSQMQTCLDAFRVYYDSRTNNRRLRWIHELGSVSLAAHFPKRRLELVVNTLQAVVLLQFNESIELTIQQLTELTGMAPDLMKQTLKSLVSGRAKILVKSPAEGYSVAHKMRVNAAFTSPSLRVRVPPPVRKSAATKEREGAAVSVAEERKHAMEANIVRIMKARKVMQHQQLMVEVGSFFRSRCTPALAM
jgi:cullin 1